MRLAERPPRGLVDLRGNAGDPAFRRVARRAFGVPVPTAPNTASARGERRLLWLGPDEWLGVTPDGGAERAMAALARGLGTGPWAAVDVSDARAAIGLAGERAREVLMKGMSVDLHPRAFAAGQCAQTRLARCPVLVHQVDDAPEYDVYVARSFAVYAWEWLIDAAGEYGVAGLD